MVVVAVGAVDMVEAEAAEDMVVVEDRVEVGEVMVEVEEVSLLMVEEAMAVGALYPPMVVEVVVEEEEVEDPLPHMVEVEAHKPLTAEVAA